MNDCFAHDWQGDTCRTCRKTRCAVNATWRTKTRCNNVAVAGKVVCRLHRHADLAVAHTSS